MDRLVAVIVGAVVAGAAEEVENYLCLIVFPNVVEPAAGFNHFGDDSEIASRDHDLAHDLYRHT